MGAASPGCFPPKDIRKLLEGSGRLQAWFCEPADDFQNRMAWSISDNVPGSQSDQNKGCTLLHGKTRLETWTLHSNFELSPMRAVH
jgi:hypothetical protein